MPPARDDDPVRRSVIPPRAARSLWLAAAWTGAGTAVVAGIAAIAVVAVLWLPASGDAGNANSAVRAGLLTFLAAVHGGVTVDGLAADFVPLGLTLMVAAIAWRAGSGLADAADDLDEIERGRLVGAGLLQAAVFAIVCAVTGRLATLGTSSVPPFGVTLAAFLLFLVTGGIAFVRWSPLGEDLIAALPDWVIPSVRAAAAVVAVYVVGGALLAAGAIVVHHGRVETLSAQVGGGLSGVPVLVLGALAAPNAVIAGSSYLAGPGFAVGSGNSVSYWSGAHGVVPAFPILGGLPDGPAGVGAWLLGAVTLLVAGGCAAASVSRDGATWTTRAADLTRAGIIAAFVGVLAAWQGGGSIGSGRLSAVGASAWQFGLALAAVTLVGGSAGLLALAVRDRLADRKPGVARLQTLAERATAAAERFETAHTVVEVDDDRGGVLRATLRSVATAITVTPEERDDAADRVPTERVAVTPSESSSEITAPIPRVVAPPSADDDPEPSGSEQRAG